MCGIAGIVALDGRQPVDSAALAAMSARMHRRGPDGEGVWVNDSGIAAMAHRRLAIIDLTEEAAQPMVSSSGRYVISFNGEIYNYPALRAQLCSQGVSLRSHSDTEVILELFARQGPDMLAMLRGMFAIAIWDNQERSLFLARDPYGIKPLYVAEYGGKLAFASQVKALLTDPALPRTLNLAGLAGFHLWGSVPEPHTLFAHIRQLPAGHWMQASVGQLPGEPKCFYDISTAMQPTVDHWVDLQSPLRESVQHHLVADVEVGCFLSGGIDSGALVGLMRDLGQERIRTFTLRFAELAGTDSDEGPHAQMVADHYGTDHHVDTIDEADFRASMPAILDAMDQPSIDGVNKWFVSRAAHRAGLKVIFSGLGGDELLGAYSTFRTVPAMVRRWRAIGRIPLAQAAMQAVVPPMARMMLGNLPKASAIPRYSMDIASAYILRRCLRPPETIVASDRSGLLAQGFAQLAMHQQLSQKIAEPHLHEIQQIAILESVRYLRDQLLRDADWAGMAHSLEIRVPLVDVELLKAFGPVMSRLSAGSGKRILATAPSRPLPKALMEREKSGFSIPVDRWSRSDGATGSAPLSAWSQRVLDHYAATTGLDLPDMTA